MMSLKGFLEPIVCTPVHSVEGRIPPIKKMTDDA
jgi:hypothetical protein